MSGLYKQFESDPKLENEGVWYDYGDFRTKLRFAGGVNKAYLGVLESTLKPYRRLIDQGVFPEERLRSLLMQVYAKTIVSDWHTALKDPDGNLVLNEKGETTWVDGIESKDGSLIQFSADAVLQTFRNLPNLFIDFATVATSAGNYRLANLEADGKN